MEEAYRASPDNGPADKLAVESSTRGFDKRLFVADNRILSHNIGLRDPLNSEIWVHPGDLDPAREPALRHKLTNAYSVGYPPYSADPARGRIIKALSDLVDVPPDAQTRAIQSPQHPSPHPPNPYQYPLSHLNQGAPFPKTPDPEELQHIREGTGMYLLLEQELADRGYGSLMGDTIQALQQRGVMDPTAEQLLHEWSDALGVNAVPLIKKVNSQGFNGMAEVLEADPQKVAAIETFVPYLEQHGYSLNDVLSWEFGRRLPGMEGQPPERVLSAGLDTRIDHMIDYFRDELAQYPAAPEQRFHEAKLVDAMEAIPSVIPELFFEEEGQIIFTQEPSVSQISGYHFDGFHQMMHSNKDPEKRVSQIYVSKDLGTPESTRLIIHELHHLLYPQDFITPQGAMRGDELLQEDETRLGQLLALTNRYQAGTDADKAQILEILDTDFSANGIRLRDVLEETSINTFIGAVNEAYQQLQMESPHFSEIRSYRAPLDRFREIIPRYAEMRFVEHLDHPAMMEFIAPNITRIYEDIYIPHLEERLNYLKQQPGPTRTEALQSQVAFPAHSVDVTPPISTLDFHGDHINVAYPANLAPDYRPPVLTPELAQGGGVAVSASESGLGEAAIRQSEQRFAASESPEPMMDAPVVIRGAMATEAGLLPLSGQESGQESRRDYASEIFACHGETPTPNVETREAEPLGRGVGLQAAIANRGM